MYLTKQRLTIFHRETREYIEDLEVDEVVEGSRDANRCLIGEGGVNFRTERGKTFFLPFHKFSFILRRLRAK